MPNIIFIIKIKNLILILSSIHIIKVVAMGKKNGYYGGLAGLVVAATLQPLDNVKMALIVPP